jgi:short-subunit dehydrogenase
MEAMERRLALITGGSSGIGLELARQLLDADHEVLLVAEQGVEAAVAELGGAGSVEGVEADLAIFDDNERVVAAVQRRGQPVDVLALNAGVAVAGPFVETPLRDELNLLQLNSGSVVHLAKRLLPAMVARGEGRVLVTSSIAATMPGTYYATYGASKSFLLSFAEAIRYELKSSGVTVTTVMPGPTDTDFFERAGMQDTPVGQKAKKDDPAKVAKDALKALFAGDDKVVAGSAKNTVQASTAKVLPETTRAAMHAAQTKPQNLDE